jgi:hypothetical protein
MISEQKKYFPRKDQPLDQKIAEARVDSPKDRRGSWRKKTENTTVDDDRQETEDSLRLAEVRKKLATEEPEHQTEGAFFEPEYEIRQIMKVPSRERKTKLKEVKEAILQQKMGLAQIEKSLLNTIQKNPDAPISQLRAGVLPTEDQFRLSRKQREAIGTALEIYARQHAAIEKITKECSKKKWLRKGQRLDEGMLYAKLFGRKPRGKIQAIIGPMSIHFRSFNSKDFTHAIEVNKDQKSSRGEIKRIKRISGAKLNDFKYPGLEDAITLENAEFNREKPFDRFMDTKKYEIYDHETRHVFNSLMNKAYNPEEIEQIGAKGNGKDQDTKIESRIKDEILAYYRNGQSPRDIRQTLLDRRTIYDYGFQYKPESKKAYNSYFKSDYVQLVENGIVAFNDLLRSNRSLERSLALLSKEPLTKWPKAVERLLDKKKSPRKMRRDRKRLRSDKERFFRAIRFKFD